MNTVIKTATSKNGEILNVTYDTYVLKPESSLGLKIVGNKNFTFVDEQVESLQIRNIVDRDGNVKKSFLRDNIAYPVYGYIHGDTTLDICPFGCPFDSGLVGYVYVPKKVVKELLGIKRLDKKSKDIILNEVLNYLKYTVAYINGALCRLEIVDSYDEIDILEEGFLYEDIDNILSKYI